MFSKKETQKATLNYIHKTCWQVAKPLAGNVLKAVVLRGGAWKRKRNSFRSLHYCGTYAMYTCTQF